MQRFLLALLLSIGLTTACAQRPVVVYAAPPSYVVEPYGHRDLERQRAERYEAERRRVVEEERHRHDAPHS